MDKKLKLMTDILYALQMAWEYSGKNSKKNLND